MIQLDVRQDICSKKHSLNSIMDRTRCGEYQDSGKSGHCLYVSQDFCISGISYGNRQFAI
jgi:hypothetical protein